jgi:hypothetical protein
MLCPYTETTFWGGMGGIICAAVIAGAKSASISPSVTLATVFQPCFNFRISASLERTKGFRI